MTRLSLALVLSMLSLAPAAAQEVANVKYAVTVSIASGDTKAQVKTLAMDLLTKISGRDAVPGEPTNFQRFILADTVPEIPVVLVVGIASDVSSAVRVELERIPPSAIRFQWYSQPHDRATLDTLLLNEVRTTDAADHYWRLHPGDSLAGFLPDNFLPIQ